MREDNQDKMQNATILIVDDAESNIKILSTILKNEGFKVRVALDGAEAFNEIEKHIPDLIILDIVLPDISGFDICKKIKADENFKNIPVIFISGLVNIKHKLLAFKNGGVDYITKPFSVDEVLARVKTHLELVNQNKKLIELNATKNKFFSIIAHDLKGPIGNLMVMSDSLASDQGMDEESFNMFLKFQKELSKDTMELLENLLTWANTNTYQIENRPEKSDVNHIIQSILNSYKNQIQKKDLTVSDNYQESFYANVDPNLVRQVIRNLVSNAVKFTPHGGSVNISTNSDEHYQCIIEVSDTGIGMNSDLLNVLFRIDVVRKRPGTDGENGSGLGLLICREFVDLMNGKMEISSDETKGSDFKVFIP